jgi:hypothetical protein
LRSAARNPREVPEAEEDLVRKLSRLAVSIASAILVAAIWLASSPVAAFAEMDWGG